MIIKNNYAEKSIYISSGILSPGQSIEVTDQEAEKLMCLYPSIVLDELETLKKEKSKSAK